MARSLRRTAGVANVCCPSPESNRCANRGPLRQAPETAGKSVAEPPASGHRKLRTCPLLLPCWQRSRHRQQPSGQLGRGRSGAASIRGRAASRRDSGRFPTREPMATVADRMARLSGLTVRRSHRPAFSPSSVLNDSSGRLKKRRRSLDGASLNGGATGAERPRVHHAGTVRRGGRKPLVDGWLTGFEPATSGTTIQRSNQLSYSHRIATPAWPSRKKKHNAGGAARNGTAAR